MNASQKDYCSNLPYSTTDSSLAIKIMVNDVRRGSGVSLDEKLHFLDLADQRQTKTNLKTCYLKDQVSSFNSADLVDLTGFKLKHFSYLLLLRASCFTSLTSFTTFAASSSFTAKKHRHSVTSTISYSSYSTIELTSVIAHFVSLYLAELICSFSFVHTIANLWASVNDAFTAVIVSVTTIKRLLVR